MQHGITSISPCGWEPLTLVAHDLSVIQSFKFDWPMLVCTCCLRFV